MTRRERRALRLWQTTEIAKRPPNHTIGRYSVKSARFPLAVIRPSATASAQLSLPVATLRKVTGSASTTLGGVPRVCRGPGMHCTAPNGGTRTSTERPGCRAASSASTNRTASRSIILSGCTQLSIADSVSAKAWDLLLCTDMRGRYAAHSL